jgi:hypothetical protein
LGHRHSEFNYQKLQGVGRRDQSEQVNQAWYRSAEYIFRGMLDELSLDKEKNRLLEFGYGTGFYTKLINSLGFKNYLGVDIVDTHIKHITNDLSHFTGDFQKADIGTQKVEFKDASLIFSIDMTQHIVNDDKFRYFLKENVRKTYRKMASSSLPTPLKIKNMLFTKFPEVLFLMKKP